MDKPAAHAGPASETVLAPEARPCVVEPTILHKVEPRREFYRRKYAGDGGTP